MGAYSRHAVDMLVTLAGCRIAFVGTGWTVSYLVTTDGHRNHSSPFVLAPSRGGNTDQRMSPWPKKDFQ